jgi:hypothetical protein
MHRQSPLLVPEERTRCEVWSRVMGYHRPVSAWNLGKQSEHRARLPFQEAPRPTPRVP